MKKAIRNNPEPIEDVPTLKQRIRELEKSVAESRRTEEVLRESEAKYRLAFESTSDGIFTIDRNFNISSITPSVERQLGYKVEEVLNRPIQDLNILTSESLMRAVSDVMQILSGVEVTGAVYEFIAKDGTRKIGEVTGTPIIREGRILGVTAVVRDITERKRTEEEIQSLARFPSENPNPVLRIARDGTLLYINQAGLILLPEWHLQVGQSVPSMLKDLVSEALNSKSPLLLDLEQRERVYSFFITPIANEGYTNMYGRDITDRKRAEEELRRNQHFSEQLAQEISIISEIGKVVGSTLHIEEVYDSFAAEVLKLISFDRLAVNLHSPHDENVRVAYVFGEAISGRGKGGLFPLKGSVSEVLAKTREGLYSYRGEGQEIDQPFDNYAATIQEGLRSLMSVPLIYRDEVIGSLHFRSKTPNAYTDRELRLAERIGKQIAGAIGGAQLYTDLRKKEQELKESEERYRELSIVDDLTQLYNSRHFYFQLKIELDRSNRYEQPLTLLLLDLDNFKAFNDSYGHVEGDQVLRRLGQVVKRCLRETDFAFRYGGEEFTILLPMTTGEEGAVTAERIRTEFKKETFSPVSAQEVRMTVSIGLAQYRPQEEMKAFVRRADQLMYQGKKNGKDRVCSESSSQEQFKW
jgi:diguanylate cyclase (GGDEF)-like protein/PAS domain S-box-containing protein